MEVDELSAGICFLNNTKCQLVSFESGEKATDQNAQSLLTPPFLPPPHSAQMCTTPACWEFCCTSAQGSMQITTAPGPVDRTSPFPTAPCQPLLPLSGYYSLDFLSYLSHNCSTHPLPAPEPTLPGRPLSLDSLLAYTTRRPGAALPAPSPAPPAAPSPQATDQDPDPIFAPSRLRTAHFEHNRRFAPLLWISPVDFAHRLRMRILRLLRNCDGLAQMPCSSWSRPSSSTFV